jgi:flagellar biosynthesis chaperone FliJ
MKTNITNFIAIGLLSVASLTANAQSWKLLGNAGTSPTTNFVGTTDYKGLAFRTNNLERMRLGRDGNFGVGTTSPSARLHVVGDYVSLSSPGHLTLGNITGSNMGLDYNVIQSRYNGSASSLYLNYYGGAVWIGSHTGSSIPAIYATADGRVGIGSNNTASGFALTVNASSSYSGINVTDPVGNYILYSSKSGAGYGIYVSKTSTTSSTATIYSSTAGSGQGVYAFSSSGIGVYGYNSSGTTSGVYGYSPGGTGSNGTYGYCGGFGTGVKGYCINGSGVSGYSENYVGVYGDIGAGGSYAGFFSGDVFTTGSYLPSDQKLKEDIRDFSSAMEIINQLHPKQYQYRQDGNYKLMNLPKGNRYGLIAEDVEKVLPNLIKESQYKTRMLENKPVNPNSAAVESNTSTTNTQRKSETIDFKALNYTEFIPLLIKGMQEQQQRIEQLENMVEKLGGSLNASKFSSADLSGAYLRQNTPNPFSKNTVISCYVPANARQAQLVIHSQEGRQLQAYSLNTKGMNNITINAGTLTAGQYIYTLLVDGKMMDSKNMIMTK